MTILGTLTVERSAGGWSWRIAAHQKSAPNSYHVIVTSGLPKRYTKKETAERAGLTWARRFGIRLTEKP